MKKSKILMKVVAWVLVFSTFLQSGAWALTPRELLDQAKASFGFMSEDHHQGGGLSAAGLATTQSQAQSAVDQQNVLQDLQGMNFSLTTQNGDTLSYVQNTLSQITRPDGTTLNNISQDSSGNITGANLLLSDGTVQVLQGGSILGSQSPDGAQVFYDLQTGKIQRTVSASGEETTYTYSDTETLLENIHFQTVYDTDQKLKKIVDKSSGKQSFFQDGRLQRIVLADHSEILYNSAAQGNQIKVSLGAYKDASGNLYTFDASGLVTRIESSVGVRYGSLIWGVDQKIKDAEITFSNGSRGVYQSQKLVRLTDSSGQITNFTYTADRIVAASSGVSSEYQLDGTLVKSTDSVGGQSFYFTSGLHKGYKEREVDTAGNIFVYEYSANNTVERKQILRSEQTVTTFAGQSTLLARNNPFLGFEVSFNQDTDTQGVTLQSQGSYPPLQIKLIPGQDAQCTIGSSPAQLLGVRIEKSATYKVEIKLSQANAKIFIYKSGTPIPQTPTKIIQQRDWNARFNLQATNARLVLDSRSSGVYRTAVETSDRQAVYRTGAVVERVDFRIDPNTQNRPSISLNAEQKDAANHRRSFSMEYSSGKWRIQAYGGGPRSQSFTVNQNLQAGVDYVAELRFENNALNFYVYPSAQARPASPTATLSALSNAGARFSSSLDKAQGTAQVFYNLQSVSLQSVKGKALPQEMDPVRNDPNFWLVQPAQSVLEAASPAKMILYGQTGQMERVEKWDGSKFIFTNGALSQMLDPQGNITQLSVNSSDLGNILGATIEQSGAESHYNAEGKLETVRVGDITVHYKRQDSSASPQNDGGIDYLEKSDGTEIHDIVFGGQGEIQNASVYLTDGRIKFYENGHLVKSVEADRSQIFFVNDQATQMITPQDLHYDFNYMPGQIEAVLNVGSVIPAQAGISVDPRFRADDTVVRMVYDSNFNLQSMVRQNNEIINFSGNHIQSILTPSQLPQTVVQLAEGYKVLQDNTETFYDSSNQIQKVLIHPQTGTGQSVPRNAGQTDLSPMGHELEITYQYGKIRQIKKDNALTFTYSYTFENDREQTVIHDLEENTTKTYEESLLQKSFDNNTSVLSNYSYDSNQKVSQVLVSRLGRSLHTYTYAYNDRATADTADDWTIVTDEAGVIRTYGQAPVTKVTLKKKDVTDPNDLDASGNPRVIGQTLEEQPLEILPLENNKLLSMEKDHKLFTYTYSLNVTQEKDGTILAGNSQESIQERLIQQTLSDGSVAHYDEWGQIQNIVLSNGLTLTDVVVDQARQIQSAKVVVPDGRTLTFSQDHLLEEVTPQNVHYSYQNGRLSRVVDENAHDYSLAYDFSLSDQLSSIHLDLGNEVLNYNSQGQIQSLEVENILTPQEILAGRVNTSSGGNGGDWGYDGNFNTAQTGGLYVDLISTQMLPTASTITSLTYRLFADANSQGSQNNGSSAYSYIQTQDATTLAWTIVPGSLLVDSHNNGGGGGSTAHATSANPAQLNVNISNVIAVRALTGTAAYANNGSGTAGGSSAIYEVELGLADLSQFQFSSSSPNGLVFQNLSGSRTVLGSQNMGVLPYFSKINEELPAELASWTQSIKSALLDTSTVTSQEYSAAGILQTQTKADQTVTLFNEHNKPVQVLDKTGNTLMQYLYDNDGNPTRVYLKNARDTLPDQIRAAREAIETQRASQLKILAQQKNLAYQTIYAQAETQRQLLGFQIQMLEDQENYIEKIEVQGSQARSQKADALSQIQDSLDHITGVITQISSSEADAYAGLNAQVQTLSNQINLDAQHAFSDLDTQGLLLEKEILRQEVSPIVYDVYRRVLGRDPNSQEYDGWISQLSYSQNNGLAEAKTLSGIGLTQAIATSLSNSQELADRQAYVQAVRSGVSAQIQQFLNLSDAGKLAFAQNLGLPAQDLIALSQADAQKIMTWLSSRSLHFGQSAFLSLESLLDQNNISYNRIDIAQKAILIDILSGVISPLDDGDLVISVFALNKVAALYGLNLSGARLTWDDLRVIPSGTRIIAHILGNHYVVITGITQDSITYIDPGIGADKQNEVVTVSKAGFLKVWKGNVTLEQSKLQTVAGYQNKVLSATQTQQIRGAFFGSILGLIGSILTWVPGLNGIGIALTAISAAVSAIEGDFISAISSIVTLGMANLGSFFQTAFDGVIKAMGPLGQAFSKVGQVFGSIYNGVVGFINSAVGFLPGIGTALQGAAGALHTTIGNAIVNTALSTGLNIGATKGLTALGVSPQIASFLGQLTAGAVIGALQPQTMAGGHVAITQAQNIQAAVQQTIILNQVGRLGTELGLDPSFTNIIGLSLGAIQGQLITNPSADPLTYAFSNIKPELFSSLAQYGIQKLGTSLGIDPRLSTLIGSPISAGIGTAFGQGVTAGTQIINSINDGLLRGVTSLGIEYATQNVDPLLGSLTSRAVTGAIEGMLGGNIFDGIFRAYSQSVLNVARLGVSGSDSWSQAQYIQRATNFSTIVQQKGLAQAIEDTATQVMTEDSISSILKSFQTVGAFIQDQIQGNKPQSVQQDGTTYKKVLLANGDYQIYTADYKDLVEVKMGNTILRGTFGRDETGLLGLKTGTISIYDASGKLQSKTYIENGWNIEDVHYSVDPLSGQEAVDLTVKPIKGKLGITFDEFGNYRDADLIGKDNQFHFSINSGIATSAQYGFQFMADSDLTWLSQQGLDSASLNNLLFNETVDATGNYATSLRWEANNSLIPENWVDAFKSPDSAERIMNAFQGFGFRTNSEIAQHFSNDAEILKTAAKTGTIISVRGRTLSAAVIKTVTSGPVNHTATLYIDNQGQRWVFEELGPLPQQGLQKVRLDDWLARYQSEKPDINIGGLDQVGADQDIKQAIERSFFYWNRDANGNWTMTDEVIPMPYNTANLIGLSSGGNICSSLIVELYRDSGHPLFGLTETDVQLQYSPNDVYRRLKLLGYTD